RREQVAEHRRGGDQRQFMAAPVARGHGGQNRHVPLGKIQRDAEKAEPGAGGFPQVDAARVAVPHLPDVPLRQQPEPKGKHQRSGEKGGQHPEPHQRPFLPTWICRPFQTTSRLTVTWYTEYRIMAAKLMSGRVWRISKGRNEPTHFDRCHSCAAYSR